MYTLLVSLHVITSVLLVVVILMQSSKGGGLAGTFGGAGSSTVFGGRGVATFLSKVTTGLAVAFFVIAILISFTRGPRSEQSSIVREEAQQLTPASGLPVPQGVTIQEDERTTPGPPVEPEEE